MSRSDRSGPARGAGSRGDPADQPPESPVHFLERPAGEHVGDGLDGGADAQLFHGIEDAQPRRVLGGIRSRREFPPPERKLEQERGEHGQRADDRHQQGDGRVERSERGTERTERTTADSRPAPRAAATWAARKGTIMRRPRAASAARRPERPSRTRDHELEGQPQGQQAGDALERALHAEADRRRRGGLAHGQDREERFRMAVRPDGVAFAQVGEQRAGDALPRGRDRRRGKVRKGEDPDPHDPQGEAVPPGALELEPQRLGQVRESVGSEGGRSSRRRPALRRAGRVSLGTPNPAARRRARAPRA